MAAAGLERIGDTPEEFARYLAAEADKWGKLVKAANIRAE
jgi:tripartite-type tricarboxylate transporter receptor subunit TctC